MNTQWYLKAICHPESGGLRNRNNYFCMPKLCDHTSVWMLVYSEDRNSLLLIERKKFPFWFAPPAGHVDDDPTFEDAARRELEEEVWLVCDVMKLCVEWRKENRCRREDGTWHYWKNIRNDGKKWQCESKFGRDETSGIFWYREHSHYDGANRVVFAVKNFRDRLGSKSRDWNRFLRMVQTT